MTAQRGDSAPPPAAHTHYEGMGDCPRCPSLSAALDAVVATSEELLNRLSPSAAAPAQDDTGCDCTATDLHDRDCPAASAAGTVDEETLRGELARDVESALDAAYGYSSYRWPQQEDCTRIADALLAGDAIRPLLSALAATRAALAAEQVRVERVERLIEHTKLLRASSRFIHADTLATALSAGGGEHEKGAR